MSRTLVALSLIIAFLAAACCSKQESPKPAPQLSQPAIGSRGADVVALDEMGRPVKAIEAPKFEPSESLADLDKPLRNETVWMGRQREALRKALLIVERDAGLTNWNITVYGKLMAAIITDAEHDKVYEIVMENEWRASGYVTEGMKPKERFYASTSSLEDFQVQSGGPKGGFDFSVQEAPWVAKALVEKFKKK